MHNHNQPVFDKLCAAGVHLLISLVLAVFCYVLVYFVWYADGLAVATGVGALFLMMLGIDVVLGPIFTLLVYKKGKKTLVFDLAVIALIQFCALIYGMYSVYQGRPVWVAFAVDRFELVRANEVVVEDGETVPMPRFFPKYVDIDTDVFSPQEQLDRMFTEVVSGISLAQQPKYHQSFELAKNKIIAKKAPLKDLDKYNDPIKVNATISKYPQATHYLPLKANAVDMTVLVDKEGKVVKIVDLRPW